MQIATLLLITVILWLFNKADSWLIKLNQSQLKCTIFINSLLIVFMCCCRLTPLIYHWGADVVTILLHEIILAWIKYIRCFLTHFILIIIMPLRHLPTKHIRHLPTFKVLTLTLQYLIKLHLLRQFLLLIHPFFISTTKAIIIHWPILRLNHACKWSVLFRWWCDDVRV